MELPEEAALGFVLPAEPLRGRRWDERSPGPGFSHLSPILYILETILVKGRSGGCRPTLACVWTAVRWDPHFHGRMRTSGPGS